MATLRPKNSIKMIKQLLVICFFLMEFSGYGQTQLWGMTQGGGQSGGGSVFKTDAYGNNEIVEPGFFVKVNGANPAMTNLLQASDGMLYGMTSGGGVNNMGVVFQFDPLTSAYTVKLDFAGTANGSNPQGSLIQASDGLFYGMTYEGGAANFGVLFQFDPVSSLCTKKIDFDGTSTGSNPQGTLMQASDGFLYGMTNSGGANNEGVLFRFDPVTSSLTDLMDFSGTANGSFPQSALTQAPNGMLYGTTSQGGTKGFGVLFQFDPVALSCTKMLDFTGNANGSSPIGSLILATDAKLYGTTFQGGVNGYGTLFQFDPAVSGFSKLLDLTGHTNGDFPMGSLIQAPDGKFYGTTYQGGLNGFGVLFQFDAATSSYSNKLDFDRSTNGSNPQAGLTLAADGNLYGMTNAGGVANMGVLFQYVTSSSGFVKKLDFDYAVTGNNPYGSLVKAADGKLYGLAYGGGASNMGVLFQLDPANSTYAKMFDFDGAASGSSPQGSLVQASDGNLYGMTYGGGANGMGILFQYNPLSAVCSKLFDFAGTANGSYPYGSLIQASDGKLYGMTYSGGLNDMGVLFQFDPLSSVFTDMLDFAGAASGENPLGSLVQASDGGLYGMTYSGGTNNLGVLFRFDPASSAYLKKIDFNGTSNGNNPQGNLIQARDGNLYGMTSEGGATNQGVLFQFNPLTEVYTDEIDFDGTTKGQFPYGSLMQASDGNLYGMTFSGGTNNAGVMFQFDPAALNFSKKIDFAGGNGAFPYYTGLLEIGVSITTDPVSANACAGNAIAVPYSITGAFDPGNVFTAQLSDGSGSFASPVNIGSSTAIAPGTINAAIPALSAAANGYLIRVISSSPVATGSDNGSPVAIHTLPAVTANSSASVVCAGSTVVLTGGGANTYSWTGAVDGIPFSPTATNAYTVTGTDGNNCSNSATTTVTVTHLPDATTSASGADISSNQALAVYQWLDCNTNNTPIAGATNQSYQTSADGSYAVRITKDGCTDTSLCVNIISTGLAEQEKRLSQFSMYPNPNNGSFSIQSAGEETFLVVNELGQTIRSFKINLATSHTACIENLSTGIYFIIGISNNQMRRQKLIVY